MKKIKTILFGLFCVSLSLQAQTILTGKLIDAHSQEQLPFANVVLLQAADSTFIKGVISDVNGSFEMELPQTGKYSLRISYLGYESKTIDVRQNDMGIIELTPNAQLLDKVEVTATSKIFKMENGGIATNIQNSRLKDLGTAVDVLGQLPFVIRDNENFIVFGKGAPLIYINNRLIRDASELQEINSADLKKVTVITNPGSEYDATVQSVIKIETLRPQGEGLSGSVTGNVYIDRMFSHNEQINVNYRKNRLDIFGMFRFAQSKNKLYNNMEQSTCFNEPVSTQLHSVIHQQVDRIRSNAGFNYLFGKDNSVGLKYELTHTPFSQATLHPSMTVYRNNQLSEMFNSDWDTRDNQNSHYLNSYLYLHPFSWLSVKWDMDYATGANTNSQNVINYYTDLTEEIQTNSDQDYNLYATKLTMITPINKGELTYGGEFSNTQNQQNFYINEDGVTQNLVPNNNTAKQNLFAAFVAFAQPFGNFSANAGIRYENTNFGYYVNNVKESDQSQIYRNWFPSVGINYRNKKYSVALNYRNTIYRPSYYQLRNSVQYDSPYTYESGNPYLKPININTLSGLFMWNDIKLMVDFNLYKNNILFIPEQYSDETVLVRPINLDKSQKLSTIVSYSPVFGIWSPNLEVGVSKDFIAYREESYNEPYYFVNMRNSIMLFKSYQMGADISYRTSGNTSMNYLYDVFKMNVYFSKSFLQNTLRVNLRGTDIFNSEKDKRDMIVNGIVVKVAHDYNTQGIHLSITYRFNATSNKYKGESASDELNRL